jgi:DNA-binding response OmpR family regulator
MKLLLVEDNRQMVDTLSRVLKKNGYAVDAALDGDTGMEMAASGIYDVIILGRMLPRRDGLEVLREFRGLGFATPVLMLTARDAPQDRVEGLDAGADDYLVKPFFTEELLARLRALLRRKDKALAGYTLCAAGLTLDPTRGEVTRDGAAIHLTVKETLLLELLMRNPGQVVPKERIMEKVWGYNADTGMANVDLYICYLRRKLPGEYIKTVRGVGYYFAE